MSNYEDAIGRAQAMIDAAYNNAITTEGLGKYSMTRANTLAGLARVQLELASMFEPQPEVEGEGTDVSAELLVAALADGSFRSAVLHELKRPYAPLEAQADGVVELVRGVLMGETPPVVERAASEGESGRAYTCGLINDDGVMCSYPRHHRDWTNPASHSWNPDKPKSRDSERMEKPLCLAVSPALDTCQFWAGHTAPRAHSWEL